MVLVQRGTFQMGTAQSDVPALRAKFAKEAWPFYQPELPQHTETVPAFWIDSTEVTNESFMAFLRANPEWSPERVPPPLHNGTYLKGWRDGSFPAGSARHPVTYVTWYAAMAFCQWKGGRLPTEAEWELAATSLSTRGEFPWGNEMPTPARANYIESGHNAPVDVASYPPNDRGIYDMAGNVWEYMLEEWRDDYTKALVLPVGSLSNIKSRRALRGGSWGGNPVNLRLRYRDSHPPEGAGPHVGFRCVRPAASPSAQVDFQQRGSLSADPVVSGHLARTLDVSSWMRRREPR